MKTQLNETGVQVDGFSYYGDCDGGEVFFDVFFFVDRTVFLSADRFF